MSREYRERFHERIVICLKTLTQRELSCDIIFIAIKQEVLDMVGEYEWREEFNIGVESIDREHRQLFSIINKLIVMEQEGKDIEWTCKEGIKFFRNHAQTHFSNEEAYMEEIGYEGLQQHKLLHRNFKENMLPVLEQELERTNYSKQSLDHFLGVCAGWLIGHTLTEDAAIGGKNNSGRWKNLLSGDQQEDIKKVITQQMFNIFHVEAHLLSDIYGAEKFGSGIYYRLVYGTSDSNEKLEIIMVFEEQMIINTIGKVLGIHTNELDTMLIHATRYSARQLITGVMECFPELSGYGFEEEDILSYSDFYKIMSKGEHQLSLLYDTGEGYFAFCMIAPHLLEKGIGISIIADNAASEVEKYLNRFKEKANEKKKNPRKKILVVDDSLTVRETMKKMLSDIYSVSAVDSGVAAIRTIALDTPDLVLLDYEMPVCDGRQTLEMLRSDEIFANIPVIFLTGRRDPSSVIGVMPLKPAGYILKTSKPEEIKNEINDFFAKQKANA